MKCLRMCRESSRGLPGPAWEAPPCRSRQLPCRARQRASSRPASWETSWWKAPRSPTPTSWPIWRSTAPHPISSTPTLSTCMSRPGPRQGRTLRGDYHDDSAHLHDSEKAGAKKTRHDRRTYPHRQVLPIGGVKEKTIAARRSGIKTVIFPEGNRKDFEELPAYLKKGLNAHFVHDYDEVCAYCFCEKIKTGGACPPFFTCSPHDPSVRCLFC